MNSLIASPSTLRTTIARLKGDRLRALIDAAQDVSKNSSDRQLQQTARFALQEVRLAHPDWEV